MSGPTGSFLKCTIMLTLLSTSQKATGSEKLTQLCATDWAILCNNLHAVPPILNTLEHVRLQPPTCCSPSFRVTSPAPPTKEHRCDHRAPLRWQTTTHSWKKSGHYGTLARDAASNISMECCGQSGWWIAWTRCGLTRALKTLKR